MPVPSNNATASSVNGTLVATTLTLDNNAKQARVVLSGTYTGVTGTIDVSMDGTTWINRQAVQEDTGALVNGTITVSAANLSYVVDCDGWYQVRFNNTATASGTCVQTVYAASSLNSGTNPIIANTSSTTSFTSGTFSGTLGVTGATTLSSTLAVTGASTFTGTVTISNAATVGTTLAVTGAVTLSSTLSAGGTTVTTLHATGALTLDSTVGIAGDTTLSSGADLIFSGTTGQCKILFTDNLADALTIGEGANAYITFVSTNSGEKITVAKTTTMSAGFVVNSSGATAITTTRAITRADSGGVFTVAQSSAYTITVAQPTSAGERYIFQCVSPGAFDVSIVATGSTFEGTIVNDVTSVIPATGSTLKFATGAAVLGDCIELISTSTTKFLVRAVTSAAGGITVA